MAQIEAVVEPDSVGDNIWRESVALAGIHPQILPVMGFLTWRFRREVYSLYKSSKMRPKFNWIDYVASNHLVGS